ncbi:MAG: serine hydrolase domain-containing protein [Chitinophagaceae bacterium]
MLSPKKLFVLLFVLLSSLSLFAQSLPDSVTAKIDKYFAFWNNANSPGFAIGIVKGDSLIYAKGYGMANLEYNVPITPATIFHMASISKQFTAYSIVLLAAQGKLKLDDDIRKYLPWFPDLHETITIRHLLSHTSGIRDQWQLLAIAGTRIDDVITQEQIVKIISQQQALNFKPGSAYTYSNSGFTLLAEIVKAVTGQTLRTFTDSAIFKPLGMKSTHFHDDYTEIVKDRAYSYQREKLTKFSNSILSYSNAGATSLFTNTNDLAKWVSNFYRPVVGNADLIKQLTTPATLNNGATLTYALGITSDTYKGWRQFSHGGADAGFRTYITVFPDLKMGFIVFSNVGDANTSQKAYQLADIFIKDTSGKSTPAPIAIDSSRAWIKDTAVAAIIMGNYISEDGSQFKFVLRNRVLTWDRGGRSDVLYPGPADSFTVAKSPEVKFVFNTTNKKDIRVDEYWPGNHRLLVKYAADSLSVAALHAYEGDYYCPELGCTYTIQLKDQRLVMTNRKYDDSFLKLVGPDHLYSDYWWMQHLFITRNARHVITGFEVNDGRVMHLRFNKVK